MITDYSAKRNEALIALRLAIRILDEIGESMAAIHVSHAIELLGQISPEARAEVG